MTDAFDSDLEQVIRTYVEAASAHGRATAKGDYQKANVAADQVAAAYRAIRAMGLHAQRAMLPLLNSADTGVRLWAGSHALEFAPDEGEVALTLLQDEPEGLLGFSARMTLAQWRDGSLEFP